MKRLRARPEGYQKQRPQNLPTIERIDRQQVEEQKKDVHREDHEQEAIQVGRTPSGRGSLLKEVQDAERYDQRDVHERAGGDAPQDGAGSLWWSDVGDATERPEHDFVRSSANLTAGERVAEFVQQNDEKKARYSAMLQPMDE